MQSKLPTQKTYQGVDLLKFLMAACVVMIHVKSFNHGWSPGLFVNYIISLAVPFFFIASGFLLGHKLSKDGNAEVIRKYSRRICRMYFTWILIYVPLCVFGECISPSETSILKFIFVQVRSVFLLGEIRFSYPTWFLFSLAIATMLIWLSRKTRPLLILLFVAGLGGIFIQYLVVTVDMPRMVSVGMQSLSRMSIGLGYVIAGMYIYRHQKMLGLPMMVGSMALSIILFIFTLPYSETFGALGLFCFALIMPVKISQDTSLWLRQDSLWIFLMHMYLLTPLCLLTRMGNPWLVFAIVLVACIILSQGLITLSRSKDCSFLKKLV